MKKISINLKKNKKEYLNYIGFIKFISMIIIIKWHLVHEIKWSIPIGSRMCEILFISSGFLVGYNNFNSSINSSFEYSFNYVYKHLRLIYPLYLINIFYNILYNKISFNAINKKQFSFLTNIEILLIKVTLLQSWSRYKTPYFDDHTWFLSNLFFLYFLSPFLLKGTKKIKLSLILFIIIASIRILIELFLINGAINLFDSNIYYGPIIRLLEFYLGMLIVPLYFIIKSKFDNIIIYRNYIRILFTIIQFFLPIHAYLFMKKYNKLYSFYYVLLCCFFILVCAFDYGYLSNLFSHKIVKAIISCQFEIYLLQFKPNTLLMNYDFFKHSKSRITIESLFILKLLLIFTLSYCYKALLKQKLAKLMDNILFFLNRLLDIY